jgi:hypothetical protein
LAESSPAHAVLTETPPIPSPVPKNDGRFRPGNQASRKHGLYAVKPEDAPDLDVTALDDFTSGVISDLGGESDLTTLERGYVAKLRSVEALCQLAVRNIEKVGLTARSEALLLQAIDRWDRLASRLGKDRRPKDTIDLAKALSGLERR